MDQFLITLNEYNLCTWYVLPWLGMNFNSFGKENFINSYLIRGAMKVVTKVLDKELCPAVAEHPNFRGSLYRAEEQTTLLVFNIPEMWTEDYRKFLDGKYSQMSEEAKSRIRRISGLRYEEKNDKGELITHAALMALDRHPSLRKKWLEILGSDTQLPEELISVPGDQCFINLEEELN